MFTRFPTGPCPPLPTPWAAPSPWSAPRRGSSHSFPASRKSSPRSGRGNKLVACTKFCAEPADLTATLRKVGGTKDPDIAAIAALKPDLVLANVEENRRQDVRALIDAGLTVFVGYPRTVREAIAEFQTIGDLVGTSASPRIVREMNEAIERQETLNQTRRRVRVFCPIWRNPYMAVAGATYAGDLIRLAGGENVFEIHARDQRYPQVTLARDQGREP